jgi:hypothetical protein
MELARLRKMQALFQATLAAKPRYDFSAPFVSGEVGGTDGCVHGAKFRMPWQR